MNTKKCPSCDKLMIEWKSDEILYTKPPQYKIIYKCGCGFHELLRYEDIVDPSKDFMEEWKKANPEKEKSCKNCHAFATAWMYRSSSKHTDVLSFMCFIACECRDFDGFKKEMFKDDSGICKAFIENFRRLTK